MRNRGKNRTGSQWPPWPRIPLPGLFWRKCTNISALLPRFSWLLREKTDFFVYFSNSWTILTAYPPLGIPTAIRAICFIYCPTLNGSFPLVSFLTSPNHFLMRTNRNLCRFYLILFSTTALPIAALMSPNR